MRFRRTIHIELTGDLGDVNAVNERIVLGVNHPQTAAGDRVHTRIEQRMDIIKDDGTVVDAAEIRRLIQSVHERTHE